MSARSDAGGRAGRGGTILLVTGGVATAGLLVLDVAIRTVPGVHEGLPLAVCRAVSVAGLVLAVVMAWNALGLPGASSVSAGARADVARFSEEWAAVMADMPGWERVGFAADLVLRGVPLLAAQRLLRRPGSSRS